MKTAYPFNESQFKEAINTATLDFMFSPLTLGEKREVLLKPDFDTACWSFLPPHRIFIGQDIFQKDFVLKDLNDTQQSRYIENHFHHEMGHALYTVRDFKLMRKHLDKIGASFPLWNIFEDALIEHRYRTEAKYDFNWLEFEELGLGFSPSSLFFCLIQSEGNAELVRQSALKRIGDGWEQELELTFPLALDKLGTEAIDMTFALTHWLERVQYYYDKSIGCRKSFDLVPIIKEWLDEFSDAQEEHNQDGQGGQGEASSSGAGTDAKSEGGRLEDLSLGEKLQNDSKFLAQFMEDAKEMGMLEGAPAKVEQPPEPVDVRLAGNANILSRGLVARIDKDEVQKISNKLQKWFVSKSRMDTTDVPTRKPSARHFALGTPRFRSKSKIGRGTKDIVLVVDLSGSMNMNEGYHIEQGRILMAALSELSRKGFVRGHVVFSGEYDRKPIYETYAFPLSDEIISRTDACYEGEGIEGSIQANIKLCKQADLVLVYTDAQITDVPIDKARLNALGIHTVGLYAGDDARFLPDLLGYFDKAIMRHDALELADAIVAQLK